MRTPATSRLADAVVMRTLEARAANEHDATSDVLPYLAEADARKLYLPAGYQSMQAFCVGRLGYSEDSAAKRIWAARTARRHPALFDAVAERRLHLSAVRLLAPHLTEANADELIAAATHRSKTEIEEFLARRFPGTESLELVEVIPRDGMGRGQQAPGRAGAEVHGSTGGWLGEQAPGPVEAGAEQAPGPVQVPPTRVKPLATDRYTLQVTIDREGYDLLRYAQALMSHQVPSGDIAQVIVRSLRETVDRIEKRKFGKTTKPRSGARRPSLDPRHIPAHVKHAVWERDRGQCTFVGDGGRRCGTRTRLQFDHIDPVARGGQATVENIRLRCRGHNQLEADRAFGAGFMHEKREEGQRARAVEAAAREAEASARHTAEAEARARAEEADARARAEARQRSQDLTTCLRELRFSAAEARRAVEFCAKRPEATLEEQVRVALGFLCPKPRSMFAAGTGELRACEGVAAP